MTSTDSHRLRRLKKEASQAKKAIETDDVQVYTIDNISSDYTIWSVTIIPPETSLYYGGKFKLLLNFPPAYPLQPPTTRFETRIFNPNVDAESGDTLFCENGPEWCPLYGGDSFIRSIIASIDHPQLKTLKAEEPSIEGESDMVELNLVANWDAADLWLNDREQYETRIAEWLVMYAICDGEDDGFVII